MIMTTGYIQLEYMPTSDMVADMLTKALLKLTFMKHVEAMNICPMAYYDVNIFHASVSFFVAIFFTI